MPPRTGHPRSVASPLPSSRGRRPAHGSARSGSGEPALGDKRNVQVQKLEQWLNGLRKVLKEGSHYEVLQLRNDADHKQIQERRTEWIRSYHPDLFQAIRLHGNLKQRLDNAWRAINTASSVLQNKDKRREYDIFLDRKRKGLPTDTNDIVKAEKYFRDGDRLLKGHRYKDALDHFEKALRLNAKETETQACHAWAEYQVSKMQRSTDYRVRDRSKEVLTEAIDRAKALARARFYLAMILKDEGKNREALYYFHETLDIDPYYVDAKREIRMLQTKRGRGDKKSGGALFGFGSKRK